MKKIILLFGIMMALVVCITPVAAVSADDFEVVTWKSDEKNIFTGTSKLSKYTYSNKNNQYEEYIVINTTGTKNMHSYVTFKPVNIPDAPVMVVNTGESTLALPAEVSIYLPRSVDDWEIKYYSKFGDIPPLTDEYLKNAGVVNLNEYFEKCISKQLLLVLSWGQTISGPYPLYSSLIYTIPDVD